jgi:hypothetical protein
MRRCLWWVAGADSDILLECPKADQVFVSHLGIALICAFLFVFSCTLISLSVAFPLSEAGGYAVTAFFAFLIAATIFLIDRSFIISDWDWQASQRRAELAQAEWEDKLSNPLAAAEVERSSSWLRGSMRAAAIGFRLALSLAIGVAIASFLELVIYRDEILPSIQRQHYLDNREIYDRIGEREREIKREIEVVRSERDRLQSELRDVERRITDLRLSPSPVPSDTAVKDIEARVASIDQSIAQELEKNQTYAENMIAERNGTRLRSGNSGIPGEGRDFRTNRELKELSDAKLARLGKERAEAEEQLASARTAAADERARLASSEASAGNELETLAAARRSYLEATQKKLEETTADRSRQLELYKAQLMNSPEFIPISRGIASQFRALRELYSSYGNSIEKWMLKGLIVLVELTPIIMKIFLSPKTLYGVKSESLRREKTFHHLDRELELRQQHLRKKYEAKFEERIDGRGLDSLARDNVKPIRETMG